MADDLVSMFDVNVKTERGVVTLNGSLSNDSAIDRVISIAKHTNGVTNVINRLVKK